jgi:hypothetical protein
MLTEGQKIDVRRYCGFPIYGNGAGASPPNFGYRWLKQYLILEYRMNNMAPEEEVTLQTVYLSNLNSLEAAIPTASGNLDTDQAAVWYHNKKEVADRFALFRLWCRWLIEYMGLDPPQPMMRSFSVVI